MFKTSNVRNTKYYVIQYNDKNFRILKNKYELEKGWELIKNLCNSTDKEEVERISLSRTKSRIRELALCNNFEYFGTITINGYFCNRYELDDCQSRLKKLLRRLHDRNHDLKYLIITEKHKDGAFHFHGLFSGLDLYLNDNNYFSSKDLDELGFNSFSLIKDYNKTCNYITKYITKDCVRNSRNQVFIRSKGLNVATKEEIDFIEPEWKFDNDFCSIYDLNLDNLSDYDKKVVMEIMSKL